MTMTQDVILGVTIVVSLAVIFYFLHMLVKFTTKIEYSISPKERREIRIKELIDNIQIASYTDTNTRTRGKEIKLLQEELDRLKKEQGNENIGIIDSADQKEKLILELKKEVENLKKVKSETEKLLEIISEQKKTILDLEMELENKENAGGKLETAKIIIRQFSAENKTFFTTQDFIRKLTNEDYRPSRENNYNAKLGRFLSVRQGELSIKKVGKIGKKYSPAEWEILK